jgi:hypothetical protein
VKKPPEIFSEVQGNMPENNFVFYRPANIENMCNGCRTQVISRVHFQPIRGA